jgi:hypothetical protein
VTAAASTIAPGLSPGRLTTDAVTLGPDTTLSMELNDTTPGTGYDQLDVKGTVNVGGARLSIVSRFTPASRASFTLVLNDGTDPFVDAFAGLAEGAKVRVAGRDFTLSYRGGEETSFGARIEVTNNVPIAVERSLYWNANGIFWAGGTNALGTPLP